MEKPSDFSKPAIPGFHNLYAADSPSDLKFSCSRKPLISCTTQHDTEHTRCPFSAQLLKYPRPTTSLPIFLFFRLNSSVSSDPSPWVISLRDPITLLWTLSNDTDIALGEWCPSLGKSSPAVEKKDSSQTYQAPQTNSRDVCLFCNSMTLLTSHPVHDAL